MPAVAFARPPWSFPPRCLAWPRLGVLADARPNLRSYLRSYLRSHLRSSLRPKMAGGSAYGSSSCECSPTTPSCASTPTSGSTTTTVRLAVVQPTPPHASPCASTLPCPRRLAHCMHVAHTSLSPLLVAVVMEALMERLHPLAYSVSSAALVASSRLAWRHKAQERHRNTLRASVSAPSLQPDGSAASVVLHDEHRPPPAKPRGGEGRTSHQHHGLSIYGIARLEVSPDENVSDLVSGYERVS